MNGSMIGLVTPLFEPFVQGRQREGGRKQGKKLHSEGFEISLDFSFSLRTVRGAMDEGDPKRCGSMSELVRTERGAIVEINLSG
jgi:hypothetical protein